MFLRYFADTTDSPLGMAALEYMRSFMRLAPVRLISMTGPLAGRWCGYEQLMMTPMLGDYVSCVCCDPSRWTWLEKVPTLARTLDMSELAEGPALTIPAGEAVTGRVELYTVGKRNVLFAAAPPRSKAELGTALRYEALVVPAEDHAEAWRARGGGPVAIPVPVVDHSKIREAINLR